MDKKVETKHNIRLTSAEMAMLWSQYQLDSLATCTLSYFLNKVEDSEIKPILEYALSNSKKHVQLISDIFTHEKHPIPIGFTKDDVNLDAPRLFSDEMFLTYIKFMSMLGMGACGAAIGAVTRSDVSDLFMEVMASSVELHNQARKLLLSKGLYVRPAYISTPEVVDFVKKQNFLTGFFGQRRTLHALEITHLHYNIQTNALGKLLIMGFAQVAKSEEITQYFLRGKKIASKHIEVLSSILIENDIPAPTTWDTFLMDSTISPFSDKLMMYHIAVLNAYGQGNYGLAQASSHRRDLAIHYKRLSQEIEFYAEDGANLMIDHGWMEEPPQSDNRDALVKSKQ